MRRRKAAEEQKKDEVSSTFQLKTHCSVVNNQKQVSLQEKKPNDEPLQKLKPIIVTQKKIISLKKKPADGDQPQKPKTVALMRAMKTASVSEKTESGSQIKTILRSSSTCTTAVTKRLCIEDDDDDEIDEDELLADSPPSTPAPKAGDATLKNRTNASKDGNIPTTLFTNRRIVVRNADNVTNNENNLTNKTATGTGKGIFDRLDKKVISVNEAAKRKIQRIVINNSD